MINNTLFRPAAIKSNRKKFNPEGFDLATALKKTNSAEAEAARIVALPPKADFDVTKNYLSPFSDSQPVELVGTTSVTDTDIVIRAVYKQVFGNAHLMESERAVEAESQLRSGQITVLEFVRQLAKSDRYRAVFFESCPNLRAIELNFKHLLGRAPESNAEISEHIRILAEGGFDAEIDSYLDSVEYLQTFGTDLVPYYRGHKTQTGKPVSGFTHSSQLVQGASSSDKSIHNNKSPQIQAGLLGGTPTKIQPLETLPFSTPIIPPQEVTVEEEPVVRATYVVPQYKTSEFLAAPASPTVWLQQYRAREAAATFPAARKSQPVRYGSDDIDLVIRAAYKQVFGNVHLMESQRLLAAESKLKRKDLDVKGFIRELAKSDAYRALFFESCSNVRAVELNFKHLLGRAPDNFQEISEHIVTLAEKGLEADIDTYLDSEEYNINFGSNTVPYYVSYSTRTGKPTAGYNRIFDLIKGDCSSDRSIAETIGDSQKTSLKKYVSGKVKLKPTPPVFNPKGFDLAKSIGAPIAVGDQDVGSPSITGSYTQAFDERPLVELVPGDSAGSVNVVLEAIYKQVFGNAHLMESERLPKIESQLQSGEITVQECVRLFAKSDLYRSLFFETCPNLKTVELNFKHLLGRAPESHAEISAHITILAEQGFEAEIDSYLDSDEYFQRFGAQIVPNYQGYKTQTGKALAGYTHSFQLLRGASSSDKSVNRYSSPELDQALLSNGCSAITDISETPALSVFAQEASSLLDVETTTSTTLETSSSDLKGERYTYGLNADSELSAAQRAVIWQGQFNVLANAAPVKLIPGDSVQDKEIVIRAIYKQVLSNAYVMESERLTAAEEQLFNGNLTVREFVRLLAKSDLYKSRFIDNSPRYRCHELNFKNLLGRAPDSYQETAYHSDIIDNQGYDADIDAYIDSDEYEEAFGENVVPFYRGYKTQTGKRLLGYINMFDMLESVSSSSVASPTNKSRLESRLSYLNPVDHQPIQPQKPIVRDSTTLIQKILGLV
ncbi:phycobilisome rod-core linker polypeptide [Leptothoe spongobia]|uniref:Phycobilisome rod-core linker polypeptide n=1 Tax=Leptothoe spongobia TAU-MAC 1115 TaxID=1967444 RepID=A0A947DIT9_9CYAN|nr:phycobilisome rod-core linker polypeptide [Leptothoe spongobia]MBT9316791.1 phycobilisome rod-core linker polypeptide [Leptothoe spongobia TAU-MAC 1115]